MPAGALPSHILQNLNLLSEIDLKCVVLLGVERVEHFCFEFAEAIFARTLDFLRQIRAAATHNFGYIGSDTL